MLRGYQAMFIAVEAYFLFWCAKRMRVIFKVDKKSVSFRVDAQCHTRQAHRHIFEVEEKETQNSNYGRWGILTLVGKCSLMFLECFFLCS